MKIQQLFCKHTYKPINHINSYQDCNGHIVSIWKMRCTKCDKLGTRDYRY